MRKLITVFLIALSLCVHGQTYKTVTGVLNDSTTILRSGTYSSNLDNRYAQIQDGLISGGEATLGVGSVTIDTAFYRLQDTLRTSLPRTFSGIANSPSGTQYYLVVYGEIGGTLDTVSGARDTLAVMPTIPVNTVKVNTVLVGDGGVETAAPDLSGENLQTVTNRGNSTTNSIVTKGEFLATNGNLKSAISVRGFEDSYSLVQSYLESSPTSSHPLVLQPFSGSVGIGVLSPLSSLHSFGKITSGKFQGLDGGLELKRASDGLTISSLDLDVVNSLTKLSTLYSFLAFETEGVERARFSQGNFILNSTPVTSSGTYDILTRNISTGVVEKIPSSSITTTSFAPIGSTPNANGASISSGVITLQPANGTFGGLLSATTQTIAGAKTFSGTVQSTNFGAGIAPSSSSYLALGAGTTSISSLRLPSGVAPTSPVSGDIWGLPLRLQRFDGTNTKDFIFDKTNFQFVGTAVRAITTNSDGTLAATTPILETFTTDTDVITAITGGTYNKNSTFSDTISPASSKVFYKGQMYKSSTYLYVATNDNVSYRTSLYGAETGWATYVDNAYTVGSPFSITSGTTSTLPNNAATSVTTNLPVGVTSLYNSGTSKLTPAQLGDTYTFTIRFKAKTSTASDYLDFGIDIGGGIGTIFKESKPFLKGANTEMDFSIVVPAYVGATFLANGGLVKITAHTGDLSVYNIIYDIFRTHKGIQ